MTAKLYKKYVEDIIMELTSDDLAVLSQVKKHTREVSPYHLAKFIRHMTTDQVTKSCEKLCGIGELVGIKGGRSTKYKIRTNRFFVREYLQLYPTCPREQLYKAAKEYNHPRGNIIYVIYTLKKKGKLTERNGVLKYDADGVDVKTMFNQLLAGVRK